MYGIVQGFDSVRSDACGVMTHDHCHRFEFRTQTKTRIAQPYIYDQYQRLKSPYDSADAKRERRSSSVVVFAPRRE